jgi:hypothetical protein
VSSQTAPPMMSTTYNHTDTTVIALRRLSMWRNAGLISGTAIPFASSRSVGRTSGRAVRSGTMVVAMRSMLLSFVK